MVTLKMQIHYQLSFSLFLYDKSHSQSVVSIPTDSHPLSATKREVKANKLEKSGLISDKYLHLKNNVKTQKSR